MLGGRYSTQFRMQTNNNNGNKQQDEDEDNVVNEIPKCVAGSSVTAAASDS